MRFSNSSTLVEGMRKAGILLATIVTAGLLSACGATSQAVVQVEPEEVAESTPQEPELASLFFRWQIGQNVLIAPPVSIQTQAIAACRERGYDTSYMINIGIDGDMADAEFGCRGADQ